MEARAPNAKPRTKQLRGRRGKKNGEVNSSTPGNRCDGRLVTPQEGEHEPSVFPPSKAIFGPASSKVLPRSTSLRTPLMTWEEPMALNRVTLAKTAPRRRPEEEFEEDYELEEEEEWEDEDKEEPVREEEEEEGYGEEEEYEEEFQEEEY